MSVKISIQGFEGSFHHIAAQHFFGKDVEVITCNTFKEVMLTAKKHQICNGGMIAIENSIAGSILPNYTLLQKSKLKVTGEIYLQINQHLLVNHGVTESDIQEVHSHPMALLQCADFLEMHPVWKLVETEDTALSAKEIHLDRHKHIAVIGSRMAADLFDLNIIKSNIQSNKNNYTRFLFVQMPDQSITIENVNKASVNFHTDHSKGSLARVLTKIAEGNINLSKLQSFPIPEKEWRYSFHADMEFDKLDQFQRVIENIKPLTERLNIYGVYKRGETIN